MNLSDHLDETLDRHQDFFDRALAGLRQQGKRSRNYDHCLYRSPDGCKCAVGFLIPDENYHQRLEENNAIRAIVLETIPGALLTDGSFLADMQANLHDTVDDSDSQFLPRLEEAARKFAASNFLKYTSPS